MINHIMKKSISSQSYIAGFLIALPEWVMSDRPTKYHIVAIGILILVIILDWITGIILAKKSPIVKDNSDYGIQATIRDFIIILICGGAIGLDYVFNSKSFCFAFFTAAFTWQNFYSFLGNVAALGWTRYFPLWLFNLVEDEMISKLQKYFNKEK